MPNNLKGYDFPQVLRSVYDVDKNCLRVCIVDASPGPGGGIEVIINHTDDSIRLGDGTNFITSTTIGPKNGYDIYVINEDLDIRDLDASQDSVAIKDSDGDQLGINTDGSTNTRININPNLSGLQKYGEINSLTSGSETTIISHIAVGGRTTYLQAVSVSGDNIAKYRVKINGLIIETKRTYFGGDLDKNFNFNGEMNPGLQVSVGDIITVTVEHDRPMVGDFNGKIQYLEAI